MSTKKLKTTLLDSALAHPTGTWSDGTTIWIADQVDHKVYAHTLAPFARDSTKDITLHTTGTDDALKNEDPTGIWSDHQTLWVSDREDSKLYAYTLADDPLTPSTETFGARDAGKDLTLDPLNSEPRGIWGRPGILWVANDDTQRNNGKLYAYIVPTSDNTGLRITIDTNGPFILTPKNNSHTHNVTGTTGSITVAATPLDVRAVASIVNPDADHTTPGIQLNHPMGPRPHPSHHHSHRPKRDHHPHLPRPSPKNPHRPHPWRIPSSRLSVPSPGMGPANGPGNIPHNPLRDTLHTPERR